MNKSVTLTGIELCRGMAAFAVILVHSGDKTWGLPITENAIEFRLLFYFAVPFFIASYFYFATRKSPGTITKNLWQRKIKRILIPYGIWSSLYLISKSFICVFTGESDQLSKLWSDPINIIFFGSASYHLYFLPILLSGTLLLFLAKYLTRQKTSVLLIECLLTIILWQWLVFSENSFALGEYVAFPAILDLLDSETLFYSVFRVILVTLAWIINCLPYFFIALLLNHVFQPERYRWLHYRLTSLMFLLCLIFLSIFQEDFILKLDVAIAYCLLLFGISISQKLKSNLVNNLGYCSFGIYFIHPYIKSIVDLGLKIAFPQLVQTVSIFSMLLYAVPTFILSWMVINIFKRNKFIAKYI